MEQKKKKKKKNGYTIRLHNLDQKKKKKKKKKRREQTFQTSLQTHSRFFRGNRGEKRRSPIRSPEEWRGGSSILRWGRKGVSLSKTRRRGARRERFSTLSGRGRRGREGRTWTRRGNSSNLGHGSLGGG